MTSTQPDNLPAGRSAADVSRIPALDSLRGVAIFMVVASHFLPANLLPLDKWPGTIADSFGPGGVLLFFLLSGYLIFRNLQRQPLPCFLLRRSFKLLPAYWLNILVIAAMGALFVGAPQFPVATYLSNFFIAQDVFRDDNISGNYWTLVIEARFYLFVALQFYFFGNRHVLVFPALVLTLNFVFWLVTGRGSVLLTYLPVFYVGIEIFRAEASGWSGAALFRLASVTAVVAASMLLFVASRNISSALYVAILAPLFVCFLWRGLYASLLGFFGRISYSLYLYHGVLGFELLRYFQTSSIPIGLQVLMAFAMTTFISYLSFVWVEETGVRLGKRVEKRYLRRVA